MDIIGKDEFESFELPAIKKKDVKQLEYEVGFTKDEIDFLKEGLQRPVDFMKETAAKLKIYLDEKIAKELDEKGFIHSNTRLWLREYIELLDRIQKSIHGMKSTSINLHHISHSDMAAAMRRYKDPVEVEITAEDLPEDIRERMREAENRANEDEIEEEKEEQEEE